MSDYDPIIQELEVQFAQRREDLRQLLYAEGRPDLVVEFDRKMRDIDFGIDGTRSCWHSLSPAQRGALMDAANHGGRLVRDGREYRHRDRDELYCSIYVRTIRALCAHDLLAWDGGIPDPEAAAVITERGLFVLRHGLQQ